MRAVTAAGEAGIVAECGGFEVESSRLAALWVGAERSAVDTLLSGEAPWASSLCSATLRRSSCE